MKAIKCTKYGPPEVLQLSEVEKPIPKNNEVLIKIHATAVTASDCVIRGFEMPGNPSFPKKQIMGLMMRLFLGFSKPRNPIIGLVLSGEIESVGKDIKQFKKGDQVYGFTGSTFGTYAEYKCMSNKEIKNGSLVIKPDYISHEEAAAIVYGGVLAMYFMKQGNIQSGKKVLIYGASGAIGTTAVQLARYHGADVTGVCSSSNGELVKSLGASKVIDYTKADAIDELELYDFILDAVGEKKSSKVKTQCKKVLNSQGKYVSVDDNFHKLGPDDLLQLKKLIEAGHIKTVIDRQYPLEQIVEAHKYVDKGHKIGNVVIAV
ncbi:NAD(P)-dependent alcohol dehydrogenase [Cytophagales bacterium RKSG123]|nr:NAD(P)-dependent alcohol dehydrogenase [Xanthovirga aplysinae]